MRPCFSRRNAARTLHACLLAFATLSNGFAADALMPAPLFRIKSPTGLDSLAPRAVLDARRIQQHDGVAFHAVLSEQWVEGLVPVFAIHVDDESRFELRRVPKRGQENLTEPLFFALPRADEPHAAKIAGRWDCIATNSEGTKHYVGWELAVDSERIAGRLDQHTDYRFAFLTGGSFRSNQLELNIEYIMDRYTVRGTWRDRKLSGTWDRADGHDSGTFQATRPDPPPLLPSANNVVSLYEWRRKGTGERRYSIEPEPAGPDWERAPLPLCRVWRP